MTAGDRTARRGLVWSPGRGAARKARSALRSLLCVVAVGVLAGIAAIVFYALVEWATDVFLGLLVGHHPATVAGDGQARPATGFARPWALPLVAAGGAAAAVFLAGRVTPKTTGHGTDALIDAAHTEPERMGLRVLGRKMAGATVMIGSGGSGGTEGPIAQIGGTLGSTVARTAGVTRQRARTLLLTGAAAGIGAIFRAPMGGAVIGAELLYRRGLSVGCIPPALLGSGIAYGLFVLVHGPTPTFGALSITVPWAFPDLLPLLAAFAVLGVLCGLLGRLYACLLYSVLRATRWAVGKGTGRRAAVLGYLFPALGGLLVGTLGLVFPGVAGTGYGTAQAVMDQRQVLSLAWWTLLLLPVMKAVATSLSIGTGGPGGVFGPGLVIGATAGGALWRVSDALGLEGPGPAAFAIVGMAACLGPIIHAPLGVSILVFEATLSPGLLLPTLLAVMLARWIVGDRSLYRSQRRSVPGLRVPMALTAAIVALRRKLFRHPVRPEEDRPSVRMEPGPACGPGRAQAEDGRKSRSVARSDVR